MEYLIETPFNGRVIDIVQNGITLHGRKFVIQYPENTKVVGDSEFDDLIEAYEKDQTTKFVEISKERWWEALEVLPPCKWHHTASGAEVFHISERIQYSLVDWYVRVGDQYYNRVAPDYWTDTQLLEGL